MNKQIVYGNFSLSVTVLLMGLLLLVGCKDNILRDSPYDGKTFSQAMGSIEDLTIATNGTYSLLVGSGYRSYMSFVMNANEMGSDNVMEYITTPDPLQHNFDYNRPSNADNFETIWQESYKIIYSANQNIRGSEQLMNSASDTTDLTILKQLKGENLFIKAMTYHNLVRLFARPYTQQPSQNLGIPLVDSAKTDVAPPRSTVEEVYGQIVNDLKSAEQLMTIDKSNSYATKEAAQALLSRVYLSMENNEQAVEYATKVIDSNRYALLSKEEYPNYFAMSNEANSETIFSIHLDDNQDFQFGSYAAMFFISEGGVGWGAMGPSQSLLNQLNEYPNDIRSEFINPQYDDNGNLKKYNGFDQYFITKFTGQNGIATLSSKPFLRLAEMHLNRAEADAKMGNYKLAIEDVNTIRKRAGLTGSALFDANSMNPEGVMDAVLQERRLEFYLEGFRTFDLFRNGRPMERNYPSIAAGNLTITPDQNTAIYPVPQNAISRNPNLEQNPGFGQ